MLDASSVPPHPMPHAFQRRQRRILGVSLYAYAIGWGVLSVLHPHNDATYLLLDVALCPVVTYWCIVDGRLAGHPILLSFHQLILFAWPIAVPAYLTWSRGLRGLGFALLHTVGLCAAWLLALNATGYLVYGARWPGFIP
jgi:hypothetical protein